MSVPVDRVLVYMELTRWFVRKAVPLLQLIASGSFPGYEFDVSSDRVVRGGEVKSIFSRGKGTKL